MLMFRLVFLCCAAVVKNNVKENEARVFYLKMTGDYYRYLAEFVTDKQYEQKAADFYKQVSTPESVHRDIHARRPMPLVGWSVC